MFVDRNNGAITAVYAVSQYDGQEELPDDAIRGRGVFAFARWAGAYPAESSPDVDKDFIVMLVAVPSPHSDMPSERF